MNYELNKCICLLLTFSSGTSAKAEITKNERKFILSYDENSDKINRESADMNLTRSNGESFHLIEFDYSLYKVRQKLIVNNGIGVELTELVTTIEIEKCKKI